MINKNTRVSKNLLSLFLFCVAFSNWHCSKKVEGFDMIYRRDFPREIPASASTILSHNFIFENISSRASELFASNSATDEDIIKILPKVAQITAKFNDADFAFVNRALIYVYPVGEPNKKVEVFYREDVPVNTGGVINLNGGIADVKKIVGSDNFTMEVRLDVRGQPSRNIEAIVDFRFLAVTKE
jgi:hypothetical protein